jgi:flagellar FliL protein
MSDKQPKADATPAPAKASGGLKGKLIIAGFMGSVVMVECALAYFLIPTADQVAALAEHNLQKKLPASLSEGHDEHGENSAKTIEIDLGEYSITITQPNSPTAIRVDFHLVGTALEEESKDVQSAFDNSVHRFRDMVISEIRHLENNDLADPGLGLIKRRILEKSNALFGKPILKSVVFPDFSYIEQ